MPALMIYGATGYTGRLLTREAGARGLEPLLAGRDPAKLKTLAEPLGFAYRAFQLSDRRALEDALADVDVVLHSAGPFSATSAPMLEACLETGTHYLDITGEIDVFEACAARHDDAVDRGIAVMPGVGFDVVPSDCLAAHVKSRLPDATSLKLAIAGLGSASRGTTKSGAEAIRRPSRVRRQGHIVDSRPLVEGFDYGDGPQKSISVSWGDVSTAYHSTGIGDITVYFAATPQLEKMAGLGSLSRWFLGTAPMQVLIKRAIDRQPEGPSPEKRASGYATLLAVAENAAGERAVARLKTPEGYTLTCQTGLEIAARLLADKPEAGFKTPAMAFGPDFITEFEGCQRQDL